MTEYRIVEAPWVINCYKLERKVPNSEAWGCWTWVEVTAGAMSLKEARIYKARLEAYPKVVE